MIAPSSSRYPARLESDGRPNLVTSAGPFSNGQIRFSDRNGQKRHTQPVISRPGLREHEGLLEIQIVDLAILRGDMGAIGDRDRIAAPQFGPHSEPVHIAPFIPAVGFLLRRYRYTRPLQ
jgi:hypothetical protein